jgi:oxalate---CoA ligase
VEQSHCDSATILPVLASLMDDGPVPPIIFVGHSRPRVVCSRQSEAWTVMVKEEPRINVLPRRWLDLRGIKVRETWRAALRAVIGTIVFRPGISQVSDWHDNCILGGELMGWDIQAEIVWKLRSVYDGAEVVDVLRQLYEEGFVRRKSKESRRMWMYELGLVPVMEKEDREVYWFLGDRRWYQVNG